MVDSGTTAPTAGPNARERIAVASLALAAFALNLNTNVLGALLPFVRRELVLADGQDTWLVAAAALGSAIGAILAGPVSVRRGRRGALVAGLVAFVLFSVAHLAARSFWPFLALRCAAGVAVGIAYAAASALVAEVVPYGRRGAAMGRFTAGMFLAIAAGMPLSVAFANAGVWPAIFVVQAAVAALGCFWALRAVPSSAVGEGTGSMIALLRDGQVRAGLFATMLHTGSFFTSVQLATSWLDETGVVPKERQIWVWVGLGFASVVGSAAFGRLADRVGKRNFVLVTSVVLVGCFGVLAKEPAPTLLLVVGSLLAVTAAARTGPLQALVSGLAPTQDLAALMGLRGAAMQVGVVAFAAAASPVSREYGFRGVLILAAVCQFVSYAAIRFGVREVR